MNKPAVYKRTGRTASWSARIYDECGELKWRTASGETPLLKDMGTSHLFNAWRLIFRSCASDSTVQRIPSLSNAPATNFGKLYSEGYLLCMEVAMFSRLLGSTGLQPWQRGILGEVEALRDYRVPRQHEPHLRGVAQPRFRLNSESYLLGCLRGMVWWHEAPGPAVGTAERWHFLQALLEMWVLPPSQWSFADAP